MYETAARNLRTAERFLLVPPLEATFGSSPIAVCDISAKGARFRHAAPLDLGVKSNLQMTVEGQPRPISLEAVIVWTHADAAAPGRYVSGVRTYASPDAVSSLLAQLQTSNRTNRIEELRSTDRFFVTPALPAMFGGQPVRIENLSARGARLEFAYEPPQGTKGMLEFRVPQSEIDVTVAGEVMWSALKSITEKGSRLYRAGIFINEKPELMRLAIGRLCEIVRAALDMQSLRLKLRIMRARARQYAPSHPEIEASGLPAEQYLLIQGVREELRLNPEEAMHWYRRARLVINDPLLRSVAPLIADHPDAIAVWEYLDRSVDPTIVGRAFELPIG